MPAGRAFGLRVLLVAMAGAIFLGTGEAALRIIYRDAGKRTLGGPGGRQFEYLFRERRVARPSRSRREETGHPAHHGRGRLGHLRAGRPRLAGRLARTARARARTGRHTARDERAGAAWPRHPRARRRGRVVGEGRAARRLHLPVVRERHRSRASSALQRTLVASLAVARAAAAVLAPLLLHRQPAHVPAAAAGSHVRAVHPRRLHSGEPGVGGVRTLLSPARHARTGDGAHAPARHLSAGTVSRRVATRADHHSPHARCAARTPSRFRPPHGFDRPDSWSIGRTHADNRRSACRRQPAVQ